MLSDIRNYSKIPKAVARCQQLQSLTFLTGKDRKTVDETEIENKLIRAKVFKLYKTNITDKNDPDTGTEKSQTSNNAANKNQEVSGFWYSFAVLYLHF